MTEAGTHLRLRIFLRPHYLLGLCRSPMSWLLSFYFCQVKQWRNIGLCLTMLPICFAPLLNCRAIRNMNSAEEAFVKSVLDNLRKSNRFPLGNIVDSFDNLRYIRFA